MEPLAIEEKTPEVIRKYTQNVVPQRSPEWFVLRQKTVGSSEIHLLRKGIDVFKEHKQIHPEPMQTPNACKFGIIFEEVAKKWLRIAHHHNTIYETGSIRYQDETIPLSASPDGIITNRNALHGFDLLEIKCPMWRRIGGDIPDRYKDQMEAQLLCVPEAVTVRYYDFQFRVCNRDQYRQAVEYNRWLHIGRRKCNPCVAKPIVKGVVIMEGTNGKDIGAGVWQNKHNEVTLPDLTVQGIHDIIMTDNINADFPQQDVLHRNYICWHLDNVYSYEYVSNPKRAENILELVSRPCVREVLV
jgi:hypothetical protein